MNAPAPAGRRRAVVVTRRTELEELLERHATRGQAEFFLRTRGRDLARVQAAHDALADARRQVLAAVPREWALAEVERADLSRFLFTREDLVLVVGQDGLVANAAKYLTGQLVVGVDPGGGTGALARTRPERAAALVRDLARGREPRAEEIAMVRAEADDGQELTALNEVFLGDVGHQSARYLLSAPGGREHQCSSGVIVATGAGSTGWAASLAHDRGGRVLPAPGESRLAWFVREAWPSPATGASLTDGLLADGERLVLTVASERLVVFGDGVETDRCELTWGQDVAVGLSPRRLRLAGPDDAAGGARRERGRGRPGAAAGPDYEVHCLEGEVPPGWAVSGESVGVGHDDPGGGVDEPHRTRQEGQEQGGQAYERGAHAPVLGQAAAHAGDEPTAGAAGERGAPGLGAGGVGARGVGAGGVRVGGVRVVGVGVVGVRGPGGVGVCGVDGVVGVVACGVGGPGGVGVG